MNMLLKKAKKKRLYFVLFSVLMMAGCGNHSYQWTENKLISHAAGSIDGKSYTNSKNAFKRSYTNGHRLFEIDVSVTSDGKLVARHGWEDDLYQHLNNNQLPVNYKKFMNSYYYNKYKPMDFEDILTILKENKDVYIILDGKVESPKDVEKLYKKINEQTKNLKSNYKKRLIPQMFYKQDLSILRNYGFHDVVYVVGREKFTPESLTKFCDANDIRVVSLSRNRTTEKLVKALDKKNIKCYMYTLNNKTEMKKYLDIGVHGFFTDFVDNI